MFTGRLLVTLARLRTGLTYQAQKQGHWAHRPSGLAVVPLDMLGTMTTEQPWSWPETMDALLAAPASHRVLLENDRVRVLEVVIEPRTREPEHTHRAASVMIVDEPARIRYYVGRAMRLSPRSTPEPRSPCG